MDETVGYLKRAVLDWEALRIVYNIILLAEGLIFLWFLRGLEEASGHVCAALIGVWGSIIAFGVIANFMYCFGPVAEVYALSVLGRRLGRGRYLLFAAGLLFSMGVIAALGGRLWAYVAGHLP